jgi:hypothetical protein
MATSRFVSALLFGLPPRDVVSMILAVGVMVLVSALAGYLPAQRASRVPDGSPALRVGARLTPGSAGDHNQPTVSPSLGRAVVNLILAPYIALSATVAPEHVHEAAADHPRSAVHRHLQPHSVASDYHDHAQLADDDEHIVWLDSVGVHQAGSQVSAPVFPPAGRFQLRPRLADWAAPPNYDLAPAHGPPRACLSLRGPPSLSA